MLNNDVLCVPIYVKKIVESSELLKTYKKECQTLVESHPEGWGNDWAEFCGSWNSLFLTQDILFGSTLFQDIQQDVLQCVQEYIDSLGLYSNYKLNLDQSWLNATSSYGFQEYHHHIPNTISGCFYISSPEKYGRFYVKNPFANPPHDEIELFEEKKFITLNEGDLILFPSNLEHGVMQNPTKENRYSIAFNFNAEIK